VRRTQAVPNIKADLAGSNENPEVSTDRFGRDSRPPRAIGPDFGRPYRLWRSSVFRYCGAATRLLNTGARAGIRFFKRISGEKKRVVNYDSSLKKN
jgi:hypothetical protein